jgi:chromosome partitioning protein
MATKISVGLQKGGVGKSTTTAITSYLLAKEYKVLAIDFDPQGNMTKILTQKSIYEFTEQTIYEAITEKDATKYIQNVNENLDLIPAEDVLGFLPNQLGKMYEERVDQLTALKQLLEPLENDYDYILIDLPPMVGDWTLCGLVASDYVVVALQTDPLALEALDKFLETVELIQEEVNENLRLAGILPGMYNKKLTMDNTIVDQVREDFEEMVFDTIIPLRARIKEFSFEGIQERTAVDREVLEPYYSFVKELIERVG